MEKSSLKLHLEWIVWFVLVFVGLSFTFVIIGVDDTRVYLVIPKALIAWLLADICIGRSPKWLLKLLKIKEDSVK